MLAASLNAFFCASPIYGSAEDFTFLLDVTVSREVTPAAKQQIGETRKKCNSDDRRQWRKQGGAVGAAVSRTRVPPKARSGRWVPQPVGSRASKVAGTFLVLFWCAKENLTPRNSALPPRHRRVKPLKRKRANVPHGTLALSPHLCAAAVGMRTVYSMYPSRSSRCAVAGTPLSVIRRMAWSMVFTKMRTSFTIEMR